MANFEMIAWDETNGASDAYRHNFPHLHQACELLLLISGKADVFYYDSNQTVTHTYHAGPGDLLLFAGLEIHKVQAVGFPYRRLGVRFSLEVLHRLFHNPALSAIYNCRNSGFRHLIHLSGGALEESRRSLEGIVREFTRQEPFFRDAMQYMLGQFTTQLYRFSPEMFPPVGEENQQVLREVQAYLQQNFAKPLRIEEVARTFYLSHSHLSHAFKRFVGMTPKQYLNLCRLAYARELLATTAGPLESVAQAAGLTDANSMVRLFRRMIGVTPGAYRKAMQENEAFAYGAPLPPNQAYELAIGTRPAGQPDTK